MSSVNTQFSIAVHLMAALATSEGQETTSAKLSQSVNASPSFVRRVLAKLSKATLVRTTSGKLGSCSLVRSVEKISLLEIFEAVGAPKPFAIHDYPVQKSCAVSCGIKSSLNRVLEKTTKSVEKNLKDISLADVIKTLKK